MKIIVLSLLAIGALGAADAPKPADDPNKKTEVVSAKAAYWKAQAQAQYQRAEAATAAVSMKTAQAQEKLAEDSLPAMLEELKKACGQGFVVNNSLDCEAAPKTDSGASNPIH